MKSKNDEATQRILLLLKIDANNLFHRVKDRKTEYLEIFALRRTRTHFPMIFKNRYETTSIMDLSFCGTELITTLDQFYTQIEEISWYLFQTEDMPNTVENFIDRKIKRMEILLSTLNLYLNAELGIEGEMIEVKSESFLDEALPEEFYKDPFSEDTSKES